MHRLQIDGRGLGDGEPCFIIAELGVNHNGEKDRRPEDDRNGHAGGARAVKIQTFRKEEFVRNPDLWHKRLGLRA